MTDTLRIGYADPPYPGQAAKHYAEHPDYAGEVDHAELLQRLDADYDGWVLHTSSPALEHVLHLARDLGVGPYRVMAWVKPFAAFKRNVRVCWWLFEVAGAKSTDVLDDLYPGSGAVSAAWRSWGAQRPLEFGASA